MSETKTGSRSGSKSNLNESSVPLLDTPEETSAAEGKGNTPEKECIELSHDDEKDDSSTEKKSDSSKSDSAKKKTRRSVKVPRPPTLQQLTDDLDLEERDARHINDFVNVDFSHVLAEPHSTHGFDPFWRVSALTFRGVHRWLYRLLAAVLALPLSVAWGVVFALLSLVSIWILTPLHKVLQLVFSFIAKLIEGLTQTFLAPFFRAIGSVFSGFHVKLHHHQSEEANV